MSKAKLLVCTKGKSCRKRGGKEVFCALEDQLEHLGLEKKIRLKRVDCLGLCGNGPSVAFKPDKLLFSRVAPEDCAEIIRAICQRKKSIAKLIFKKS